MEIVVELVNLLILVFLGFVIGLIIGFSLRK
jgi:uncharacterized membrane protein SpoIIM required for sporulation